MHRVKIMVENILRIECMCAQKLCFKITPPPQKKKKKPSQNTILVPFINKFNICQQSLKTTLLEAITMSSLNLFQYPTIRQTHCNNTFVFSSDSLCPEANACAGVHRCRPHPSVR